MNAIEEYEFPKGILSNNNPIDEIFENRIAMENYEDIPSRAIFVALNIYIDIIKIDITAQVST